MSVRALPSLGCPACVGLLDARKVVKANPGFPYRCPDCGVELYPQVLLWLFATAFDLLCGFAIGAVFVVLAVISDITGIEHWLVPVFGAVSMGYVVLMNGRLLQRLKPRVVVARKGLKLAWRMMAFALITGLLWIEFQ